MILAAGRGERMRPLSDSCPKPLLPAGGKPIIGWQIERLVAAGFREIVVNIAHLGNQIEASLGDGSRFGASIRYSRESEPLEVAGGIATARDLLGDGVALVVSGDVYVELDYASLRGRAAAMATPGAPFAAHLVMVPNPAYHADGDFTLAGERVLLHGSPRLTFGNVALYAMHLFAELPQRRKLKMLPCFRDWIGRGIVSGERFDGRWANVGTPAELARLEAQLRAPASTPLPRIPS